MIIFSSNNKLNVALLTFVFNKYIDLITYKSNNKTISFLFLLLKLKSYFNSLKLLYAFNFWHHIIYANTISLNFNFTFINNNFDLSFS